jgi:YidC/Oxa1 family membrane protein insertase
LFCAGPHHFQEARALEQLRGSKSKTLVPHGYDRIDVMVDDLRGSSAIPDCVLIAPSWGKHGLVETMGVGLVKILLDAGFQVILRPHPQTSRLHSDKIDAIESQFGAHERFRWDFEVGEWRSLAEADVMISDWSGVALEYAAVRHRPVLFINTPKKINNSEFELITVPPVEVVQRERLGLVLHPEDLGSLPSVVKDLLAAPDLSVDIIDLLVVNQGKAAKHGARYLTALAKGIS